MITVMDFARLSEMTQVTLKRWTIEIEHMQEKSMEKGHNMAVRTLQCLKELIIAELKERSKKDT